MDNDMKLLIRVGIFGFIIISGLYFSVARQVDQQQALRDYHKQAETVRIEQEQRNCQQLIQARMCTQPHDSFERSLCSKNLTDFHCGKYLDVEDKIIDADRDTDRSS